MNPLRLVRLLAGLLLIATTASAAACELRMRWNDDPPYLMRDADGRVTGLYADVVGATVRRMGCTLRWVEMPWARALRELEAGRIDILAGGLRLPEREAYAHFLPQHFVSRNRLYVREAVLPRLDGAQRLDEVVTEGLRLGVQLGVVYGPDYARLLEQPAFRALLTQGASRRALWQMLAIGRVDGVIASEASARWELAEAGLQARVRATGIYVSAGEAYVMLSRRSVDAALLQRLREADEALVRDGTHARTVARYLD
jgi:polar amino acid transport system substrate-binding protein